MDNQIKDQMQNIINEIFELRNICKQRNLLNSQEYLEFEDKLNSLSVMDPNE